MNSMKPKSPRSATRLPGTGGTGALNTGSYGSSQIRASVRTSMSKASGGRPCIWRRARSSSHGRQLTRPGDTPGQHPPAAFRYRPDRERHPGPPDSRDPARRQHEISTEAGRAAVASTQPDHGHFPLHPGTGPGRTHARPQAADPRCAAGRADPRARQAGRSQCHRNALRKARPETRRAQVPADLLRESCSAVTASSLACSSSRAAGTGSCAAKNAMARSSWRR